MGNKEIVMSEVGFEPTPQENKNRDNYNLTLVEN